VVGIVQSVCKCTILTKGVRNDGYTVGFAQTDKNAHRIPGILSALQAEKQPMAIIIDNAGCLALTVGSPLSVIHR
jgi:hypothetical protein